MKINNMPDEVEKYIVARTDDEDKDKLWYYGSWDDVTRASDVAIQIRGRVFDRDEI